MGRRRIREAELVPWIEEFFRRKRYLTFREKYVGLGRPDVVAARPDPARLRERLEAGVGRLPARRLLRIQRLIERYGPMTVWELAGRMGLTPGYVSRVVSRASPVFLVREGRLVRVSRPYESYLDELVAVEVKVRDWRGGLVQADMYLYGATHAYLAILEDALAGVPEKVWDWIRERGIGIVALSRDGAARELVAARRVGPRSPALLLVASEELWEGVAAARRRG